MKRALYDILWRFGNKHSGKLIPLLLDISYIFDRLNEDVTNWRLIYGSLHLGATSLILEDKLVLVMKRTLYAILWRFCY